MDYDLDLPGFQEASWTRYAPTAMPPAISARCSIAAITSSGQPFDCPVEATILVWEWGAYLGEDALEQGVDVQVSSWARCAPNTFPAMAKSTANYANSQPHQDGSDAETDTARASPSTRWGW